MRDVFNVFLGALLTFLATLWWRYRDKRKLKVDLVTEAKATCDKLRNEYEQLINDKISLEFIANAQRRSWPKGPMPTFEEVKKSIDQHINKAGEYRDGLPQELDKIGFYFDISEDQRQIMIGLIKFHQIIIDSIKSPSPSGLFIRKPIEIEDYEGLKKWKERANEQGNGQLTRGFVQPYYKLFRELGNQIN